MCGGIKIILPWGPDGNLDFFVHNNVWGYLGIPIFHHSHEVIMKLFSFSLVLFLVLNIVYAQQVDPLSRLFSEFKDGETHLNDGRVIPGKFNYNMQLDEIEFISATGEILSIADNNSIKKVIIDNRTFVFLENRGYFEILSDSVCKLLVKRQMKIIPKGKKGAYGMTNHTSQISEFGPIFSNEGTRTYNNIRVSVALTENMYYIHTSTALVKIHNKNSVYKAFPESKQKLQVFFENEKIDFKNENHLKELIKIIEN